LNYPLRYSYKEPTRY